MTELLQTHELTCPYCWQRQTLVVDLSADQQTYIEDCEVCCNPIQISLTAENGGLVEMDAQRSQ